MTLPSSRRLTRIAALGAVAAIAAAGGAGLEAHAASSAANSSGSAAPVSPYQGSNTGGGLGSGHGGWGYGYGGYGSSGGSGSSASPVAIQPATEATAAQTVGVVNILTTIDYGQDEAAGTGIVLTSDGRILTNNHVIDGATSIAAVDLTTGRRYSASVVGDSPTDDVAVLQLKGASGLGVAPLGDSNTVAVGQSVTGIGNADNAPGTSAATGTVTALGQAITASDVGNTNAERVSGLIETSADVQPGDSGGPLLDSSGRVIGMDTAAATNPRTGATNAGYAIPIDHALDVEGQIVAGVSNATIQQGLPAFLGVQLLPDGVTGAESATTIQGVIPDTAAARLGLVPGDTLTEIGGTAVSSQRQVDAALSAHRPGDSVSIAWLDAARGRAPGHRHPGRGAGQLRPRHSATARMPLSQLSGIRNLPAVSAGHVRPIAVTLAGTAPRSLAGHDAPVLEEVSTPDAPRFLPLQCTLQAERPDWALLAESLGPLDFARTVREPQPGLLSAGQRAPGVVQLLQ